MKQNITTEQLNELSDNSYRILLEWGTERGYDSNSSWPLLSIGQMIEFLGEGRDDDSYVDDNYDHVIIHGEWGFSNDLAIAWDGEELCDVLWEAVKEKLEHK
jgi:hypothetical protein